LEKPLVKHELRGALQTVFKSAQARNGSAAQGGQAVDAGESRGMVILSSQ
jgi:hypothetical protein